MLTNKVEETDEFRLVTGKKCSRRKIKNKVVTIPNDDQQTDINIEKYLSQLKTIHVELRETKYFKEAFKVIQQCIELNEIGDIEELVCLGIGSFASSHAAMHQLAFILEIKNALKIKIAKFYDPVLNSNEKDILGCLNCDLLPNNCEGKYDINKSTLFYLPHCPKQLTNNLLWKNWKSNLLAKSLLLCNSFENTINDTPERFLLKDAAYIYRIKEFTIEYPIKNTYKFYDTFNDISLHSFSTSESNITDPEFWIKDDEPKYDEMELILSEMQNNLNII